MFVQRALTNCSSQVDTKAMAEALGFKTPASATTAWYDLKRKLKNAVASEVASTVAAPDLVPAVVSHVKGNGKAESKTAAPAAATGAATGAGLRRSGRKPIKSEAPKTAAAAPDAAAATSTGLRRSARKSNISEAPKTDENKTPKRKSRPLTTAQKVALIKSEVNPMFLLCRDNDISDGSGSE